MKSHPVPQNIMDVEFKLFGELTVRQFGYVAGGASIAFVCYIIFAGLDIVRWPLVIFFALLGLMLALFKVNDRPFEVWLANFIYAMFTSQRKVWKKSNKIPNILSSNEIRKESAGVTSTINKAPLSSVYTSPAESAKNVVDVEERESLKALDSLFENTTPGNPKITPEVIEKKEKEFEKYSPPKGDNPFMEEYTKDVKPEIKVEPKVEKPIEEEVVIKQKVDVKIPEVKVPVSSSINMDDILPETKSREDLMKSYDNEKPVNLNTDYDVKNNITPSENVNNSKENNEEYIKKLREQLEEQNKMINNLRGQGGTISTQGEASVGAQAQTPVATNLETESPKVPNIVSGIVKDHEGKGIANVTVIIKDSKYKPVRAMRSSNLGKFVTTTPLPNGDYVIEANKNDMKFESVDFTLNGGLAKSLEIFAI